MWFLIGVLILIFFIIFSYSFISRKFKSYFGSSLKEIIEAARIEDQEIPKSLSSMDSIYLEQIKNDFPDTNINELKRMSEKVIIDVFTAIDRGDCENISNGKIKSFVTKKIEELDNKKIKHNQFKIHNTVISKYTKSDGIATIYFASSFEYILCINGEQKKVQDRARVEFIYVFDVSRVSPLKKNFGINCPNCGSPISNLGDKKCSYCGTNVVNLVKKVWNCNDIVIY